MNSNYVNIHSYCSNFGYLELDNFGLTNMGIISFSILLFSLLIPIFANLHLRSHEEKSPRKPQEMD